MRLNREKRATAHNFHPIHRYSSRNLSIFLREEPNRSSIKAVRAFNRGFQPPRANHYPPRRLRNEKLLDRSILRSHHRLTSRNFRWNGEFVLRPKRWMPTFFSRRRIVFFRSRCISYRNKFVRILRPILHLVFSDFVISGILFLGIFVKFVKFF